MTEEDKDWNAVFAERKAERDAARAEALNTAKSDALTTQKESFDRDRFKEIYIQTNPDGVSEHTAWESLLNEAEYDYYVSFPDKMTLEEFIKHQKWLDGWG